MIQIDDEMFDVEAVAAGTWVPGPYGPGDQLGTYNEVTAEAGTVTTSGTLNGGGSVTAVPKGLHESDSTLNGGGSVSATVTATHAVDGELNAGGGVDATTAATRIAVGTLNGGGGLSATVTATHAVDATLNAGGGVSSTVTADHAVDGELNAGGGVASTVSHEVSVDATLNGGGDITAVATQGVKYANATLNAGGGVTAAVVGHHAVDAQANAGGGVSVVVVGQHAVDATLNAGGGITGATASGLGTSVVELALDPTLETPYLNDDTTLWIRHRVSSSSMSDGTAHADVYEGATLRKASAITTGINTSFTTTELSFTTTEHDSITDWSDLRVRLWFSDTTTVGEWEVADVWLETALSKTASGELNAGGSISATVTKSATPYVELALAALSDPETNSGHTVYFRYYDPATMGGSVDWALMDGVYEIASGILQTDLIAPQQDSYTLLGAEAGAIVNYDGLSIRLETGYGNLYVTDVWMEIPFPPPVSAILNSGGGVSETLVGHHTTRAFPKLDEGLLGPASNVGGSISAAAHQKQPWVVNATLNGGGSITAVVAATRSVDAALNGGGGITPYTLPQFPGQSVGTLNAGGSIVAAVSGRHTNEWGPNILNADDFNQESSIGTWQPDTYPRLDIIGTCSIARVNRPLAGTSSDYEIQVDPDYAWPMENVMISLGSDTNMSLNYPVKPGKRYKITALAGNVDENDGEIHIAVSWYDESGVRAHFIEAEDRFQLGYYPQTVVPTSVYGTGPASSVRSMRIHFVIEPGDPYEALVFVRDMRVRPDSSPLQAGGSIEAAVSNWDDQGRFDGPGRTDDGDEPGLTDDGVELGYTDDGVEPGDTEHVTSPGRTR